jgi:hypothetical protein
VTSGGRNQLPWKVTYQKSELVEDLPGLLMHLEQRRGYDGDQTAAINRFAAGSVIRHAPMTLIADLIEDSQGSHKARPRKLEGLPPSEDDSFGDIDFKRALLEQSENVCAYCGYEPPVPGGWPFVSPDPIIPRRMVRHGYRKEWIEDMSNLVPCCRGGRCARMGSQLRLDESAPTTMDDFFDLRDRVFVQRKARVELGVPLPGGDSTGNPVDHKRKGPH